MPEPDDELDVLRAADPVDRSSVPSASSPDARRLYERITMTEPTPVATPWPRRTRVLAAAAALLVVAGVAAIALNRDDTDGPAGSATPTSQGGPISPGGPSLGSCIETYSLTTLTHRETAFDGTIARVSGDTVTFTVNEWYRGAKSAEVTLAGATTLGGQNSAGDAISLAPGTRLLVAGDGGFAWSCGFTQSYDAAVAAQWKNALAP